MWSSVALIVVATTATVRFATAFSSSSAAAVASPAPLFFSTSSFRDRATSLFAAIDGVNEENNDETKRQDGVEWLREAMGEDAAVAETATTVPARTGLAGFAVDREMGFVAVLGFSTSYDDDDDDDADAVRYACAVVNREDTSFLRSPEALTLVQLAGGMDLGTAVLPPDALARVVAEDDDDDDDDDNESSVERGGVELVGVTAVLRGPEGSSVASNDEDDEDEDDVASTPEREAAVVALVPAVTAAVRRLPGLGAVREEDVAAAARRHADAAGRLDREAFSRLLGTLRDAADRADEEEVGDVASFTLTVSVDGGALRSVRGVDRFRALALSLRHGVVVEVDAPSSSFDAPDATALATRLPFFRPIQELEEDAKVMDGFIPSMFFQEKPPGIDDRV